MVEGGVGGVEGGVGGVVEGGIEGGIEGGVEVGCSNTVMLYRVYNSNMPHRRWYSECKEQKSTTVNTKERGVEQPPELIVPMVAVGEFRDMIWGT